MQRIEASIAALVLLSTLLSIRAAADEQVPSPPPAEAFQKPLSGIQYEKHVFQDVKYHVYRIDPRIAPLSLFWKRADGTPFENFEALRLWLEESKRRLVFATNSGIYARDYTPLGLHLEGKAEEPLEPLNLKRGGGNFFLKPNGVFFVTSGIPRILESEAYAEANPSPDIAVQSGPLLVESGRLHPRFEKDSPSKHVRSGVGVNEAGEAVFVLTSLPVNLYAFASFFRDVIECPDALYLDGNISGVYAPMTGRTSAGFKYVGIIAVVEEKKSGGES